MKPLSILIASARREAALRKNTYPKWVAYGKMKGDTARHEIECMEDIARLLLIVAGLPVTIPELDPEKPKTIQPDLIS